MTARDMANYTAPLRDPVTWNYRGYQLFGMPPSSSGGSTVGEAMNILSNFDQSGDRTTALFRYIEASKLAFADRGKYLGDTDFVDVPLKGLLSPAYAKQRAALIGDTALPTPVAPGDPKPFNGGGTVKAYRTYSKNHEQHTNHLVVSDRWGNVVSYTNTIEQIAGSGILLPHRGFLLNNELTDFNFPTGTANSVAPNKRPRSSMSPDDRHQGRSRRGGDRLAGRRDDHHDRAADPAQPARLRDEPAGGDRGAAGVEPQRRHQRRAGVHRPVRPQG